MIMQKKTDRRKKRIESASKLATEAREQMAPPSEPSKYHHEPRQRGQGDSISTQPAGVNGGTSPTHVVQDRGDVGASPKYYSEAMPPSPNDKPKYLHQVSGNQAAKENPGYTNYHQQPQQQSFGVGRFSNNNHLDYLEPFEYI